MPQGMSQCAWTVRLGASAARMRSRSMGHLFVDGVAVRGRNRATKRGRALRPAPRALAHQEAYCLTASFATCPTFLDWARRQAARGVAGGAREVETAGPMPGEALSLREAPTQGEAPPHDEPRPPRRRRDWTAPPPWMADRSPGPAGGEPRGFGALRGAAAPPPEPARPPAPR